VPGKSRANDGSVEGEVTPGQLWMNCWRTKDGGGFKQSAIRSPQIYAGDPDRRGFGVVPVCQE
jgi:hypothetical protein